VISQKKSILKTTSNKINNNKKMSAHIWKKIKECKIEKNPNFINYFK